MDYKNRKSGGKFGGTGIRSGYIRPRDYIKPRDYMAPYRHTLQPETEYERKVRNSILMSETRGPSGFSSDYKRYQISHQINNVEIGMDRKEVQKLINSSLKDAFKRFVEEHGVEQVPTEIVLVADDAVHEVVKRMQDAGQNEVKAEQPSIEIGKLNEMRQEYVAEKWKEADQAATLDEAEKIMSEIRDINSDFFNRLDSAPIETMQNQKGEIESAINEVNPLLDGSGLRNSRVDEVQEFAPAFDLTYDSNLGIRKPKRIDYDYEVEGY
ncbi:MAG: hypothetical protein ABI337_08220 [Nitrososphaera sp.]